MTLKFVGADIIHMDPKSMWVQLTKFAFDVSDDETDVLSQLLAHDAYAHDYASPFSSHPQPFDDRLHGRWRLNAIDTNGFKTVGPGNAIAVIEAWANEQDWMDPGYRQPPAVLRRLTDVYDIFRWGKTLQLDNPDDEAMHEYGFVTGSMGFHEFVVINRDTGSLHVIVASDD